MIFTGLGRSVLGETVHSVCRGGTLTRPRAQFLPIRTSQPVNNIYLLIQIARYDTPFGQFKKEKLMQLGLFIYLFFGERNINFVYQKVFGRRRVT